MHVFRCRRFLFFNQNATWKKNLARILVLFFYDDDEGGLCIEMANKLKEACAFWALKCFNLFAVCLDDVEISGKINVTISVST